MTEKVITFEKLDKALSDNGIVPIKKGQIDDEDRCCTDVSYEYHLATDGRKEGSSLNHGGILRLWQM